MCQTACQNRVTECSQITRRSGESVFPAPWSKVVIWTRETGGGGRDEAPPIAKSNQGTFMMPELRDQGFPYTPVVTNEAFTCCYFEHQVPF